MNHETKHKFVEIAGEQESCEWNKGEKAEEKQINESKGTLNEGHEQISLTWDNIKR